MQNGEFNFWVIMGHFGKFCVLEQLLQNLWLQKLRHIRITS